ncbi:hypothetical protein LZK98_11750 [Sphingomonas cannabina]|uniref:hypothetical protein n=1 Tax=Sphingomonas cannabina TaxID=2899123 RepID=UPI001F405111|nr:hypothetical protein [Sphingomonas cannabina]UIJ43765.1 hypothetical protein LZK98_11750 [Sphingomonas cannabina]
MTCQLTHREKRDLFANAMSLGTYDQIELIRALADTLKMFECRDQLLDAADALEHEMRAKGNGTFGNDERDQRRTITVDYSEHRLGEAA